MNSSRLIAGLVVVGLGVGSAVALGAGTGRSAAKAPAAREQFASPGPEYRGKPFWSWNGTLQDAELLRQMRVLKDMGMGGFFMHSRTGLETPYLSKEWFRLVNLCADAAEKQGLEAWLYDEDRWPSGTAGGMVTEIPSYRMRFLSLRTLPGAEFAWSDRFMAVFACKLNGTSFTDCARVRASTPAESYRDKTLLIFTLEEMEKSSFYNGFTYVDTMNREATEFFLQLTHDRYKQYCGARLGRSIKGIFTDEPHRGAVLSGFGISNPNKLRMAPWTAQLPERFRTQFGYDLMDRLPDLFLRREGEAVAQVKWHYMELLQQLFLQNFAEPIHAWCRTNGVALTGHVLHEDSLTCQAAMQGSLMRFYEHMDYPGVDVLTEGNRNYWIVKQLASVARQLGQKWLLSELYGVTGWQMNFASHKAVGDWQALFGINVRCHHLAWYTMAGEAKRDYPASIFYQSAWWPDYPYVEDYFSRLGVVLSQGKPACDVLVLNPVESVWCQVGVGWADGLSPKTKEIQALERQYQELFHWLAGSQLDFDYADEEMLGRLGRIEKADDGAPVLKVGQAPYRVVVAGGMTTIRASTLKLLDQFLQAGGTVIFAGAPPTHVDAVKSRAAADLAAKATPVPWNKEAVAVSCLAAVRTPVRILGADGKPVSDLFCQLRDAGDTHYLVAMNMNRERGYAGVKVRVKLERNVAEWDCVTGQRHAVPAVSKEGWTEIPCDFPPMGEHVFALSTQAERLPPKPVLAEVSRVPLAGPFTYKLGEPNVCVLDYAACQVDEQPWQPEAEVLRVDRAVRKAYGLAARGGEMVQPWYRNQQQPAPKTLGAVKLAFAFTVETAPKGPVQLVVEQPERWQIRLNDQPIAAPPKGWWVDPALATLPLPANALQLGANKLELTVAFDERVNIEAVYLLGTFGVRLDGTKKTLTRLPEALSPSDLVAQGLPFYSGPISYLIPPTQKPAKGQRVFLETPKFEAACVKVRSGKRASRMIAWPPYEADVTEAVAAGGAMEVEVVLTRRNTFGPLHLVPLRSGAYGPDHWVTAGASWSDNYMLYPSGLLAAPALSYRQAP